MVTPDTSGLEHDDLHTPDGRLYMRRYWITRLADGTSERFHHILISDADPDPHDHPWDYTTHILCGTYIEHTEHGTTTHPEDTRLTRTAETPHRLELPDGPTWTHIHTGPYRRTWGHHTPAGWVDWRNYHNLAPPPRRRRTNRRW